MSIFSTSFVFKEDGSVVKVGFWFAFVLSALEAVNVFSSSLAFSSTSTLVFDLTEGPAASFLVGDCIIIFWIFSLFFVFT